MDKRQTSDSPVLQISGSVPTFTATYKKYTLQFKKPADTSRGALHTKETYFLFLRDPDDPTRFGLGEASPLPGLSLDDGPDFESKVADLCRKLNQGQSPAEIDLAEVPALAFGLETALLDWQGGGTRRLFDTEFSGGTASLPTHGLIWMADRAGILQQVHDKVAQGFRCIKLKVGALDFAEEVALLADIRRAYPPEQIELRLDANGAFTPEHALDRLNALAAFDIFALEQPLPPGQWPALAEVCAASPIAIALDEELIGRRTLAEKRALLETIKPQHLVLKPSLIGGFTAAEEWLSLAQHFKIGWWVNSMLESNVGLSAICQWVSALPATVTHGLGTGQLFGNNIPSPLRLEGAVLRYDFSTQWDLSQIDG